MVQATYLTQAWYEVHVVPILPPVFPTHCFLPSRYVNSTTNQSPNAAHGTSDDTNCGLGRAKGARIENQSADPWFPNELETKGTQTRRES